MNMNPHKAPGLHGPRQAVMTVAGPRFGGGPDDAAAHRAHMDRLLSRLPGPVRRAVAWLLRPASRWLRIPLGFVLILGGLLGFLPVLGFWMIPLGALLLAEDFPVVRRPTVRAIDAVQRWWERRHSG